MDIKNFIKKQMKKDNSQYIMRVYDSIEKVYISKRMNLSHLVKYLKDNEKHIERIDIRLTLN